MQSNAKTTAAYGAQIASQVLGTVPFQASSRQPINLPRGIPTDYFVYAFYVLLTFTLTIAGGTTSGGNLPFGGPNLIERIEISGNHKAFGDWTRLLLQGDQLWTYQQVWGKLQTFGTNQGLGTGSPNAGTSAQFNNSNLFAGGAAGTYNVSLGLHLPMVPNDARPEEQLMYLLDAPLWNTLNFYVDWGKASELVGPTNDRTLTLSNVNCTVTRQYSKLGTSRFQLQPIPIKHTYRIVSPNPLVAQTLAFVDNINVGNFIDHIWLRTGTSAASPANSQTGTNWATMNDGIYSVVQVQRDQINQRNTDWTTLKDTTSSRALSPSSQSMVNFPGDAMIDFTEDGTVATAYDTREIALQKTRFELDGSIVPAGSGNSVLHSVYYELGGVPVFPAS